MLTLLKDRVIKTCFVIKDRVIRLYIVAVPQSTRSLKTLIYLLIILSQATRQVANATSYKIYIITIHIFCFYKAAATLLTFANLVIKVESLLVDCRLYLICIFNKGSAFTPSAASKSRAVFSVTGRRAFRISFRAE